MRQVYLLLVGVRRHTRDPAHKSNRHIVAHEGGALYMVGSKYAIVLILYGRYGKIDSLTFETGERARRSWLRKSVSEDPETMLHVIRAGSIDCSIVLTYHHSRQYLPPLQ